jgi:hypothetical protein
MIAAISVRTINELTTITRSEIKYLLKKKVYSAKQNLNMAKSHGLSQHFIQMEPSGFNAEPNQKDLISRE